MTFEEGDAVWWDSAMGRKDGVVERVDAEKGQALVRMSYWLVWMRFERLNNQTKHHAEVNAKAKQADDELWAFIRSGGKFTRRRDHL